MTITTTHDLQLGDVVVNTDPVSLRHFHSHGMGPERGVVIKSQPRSAVVPSTPFFDSYLYTIQTGPGTTTDSFNSHGFWQVVPPEEHTAAERVRSVIATWRPQDFVKKQRPAEVSDFDKKEWAILIALLPAAAQEKVDRSDLFFFEDLAIAVAEYLDSLSAPTE